ncbi:hypothetical protein [Flavobacterium lacus]|uniref:Uncharacterized protein n=1 Tax=Flavobacterium lacus TaxID=1353778 RepID=A0A328WYC4_9FLAO|nr:hypothetical protein [Flavobacterium lacus]RAR48904.1 hypothetical protein B0I10_10440 [Flavobacterium lacus]
MINVTIYLKKRHNARDLVKYLLLKKLISSASIDENNISYRLVDSVLVEDVNNIITAQSKSLLFTEILKAVRKNIGEEVPINSTPIVGVNRIFDEIIRTNTLPI